MIQYKNEINKRVRDEKTKLIYAISLALQLGFAIAIPLTGFLLLGIFLDRKFRSSPLFLLSLLIFSFC